VGKPCAKAGRGALLPPPAHVVHVHERSASLPRRRAAQHAWGGRGTHGAELEELRTASEVRARRLHSLR